MSLNGKKKHFLIRRMTEGIITMEEKVAYCNKKYGVSKWHFMTREELVQVLKLEQEKRIINRELNQ